ncbi:UbiA prenyltransferase family protein [Longispora sp. NPDC051575]|uniref:UbiA prenyltransferase family protein n=1 Tax=Longispora sp. NPDC051575 TaxID=3154943 RepID=UPI0034283AAE
MSAVEPPPVQIRPPTTVPHLPLARQRIRDLVALVRPGQWVKNLLVVPLPLLDAFALDLWSLGRIGWAVLVFTLASAIVYVCNDIADRARDRRHPVKRSRPVAAGRVPVGTAWAYAAGLAVVLALLLALQPPVTWWPVLCYLVLNAAYTRKLKHLPLLDVCVVATGFALRLMGGYTAIDTPASGWLIVAVYALCLLLIIGKRRNELQVSGVEHRPALRGYSLALADQLLVLNATVAVTAGLIYLRTEAPVGGYGKAALLLSAPFALFGLSRYLQLVLVRHAGGDPVRAVLGDRVVLGVAAVWLVALSAVVVLAHQPALAERLLP